MKNIFSAGRTRPENEPTKKESKIQGYVERIENFQIEGWAISLDGQPVDISIRINKEDHPLTVFWFERSDVAAQHGEKFLTCGFKTDLPGALVDTFLKACQDASPIAFLANNIALTSNADLYKTVGLSGKKPVKKQAGPIKESTVQAAVSDEKTPVSEVGGDTKATATKSTNVSLLINERVQDIIEDNDGLGQTPTTSAKPDIQGFVDYLDNFHVDGWVFSHDMEPLTLSLQIGKKNYPITATWTERPDVANEYGEEHLKSGFSFDLPETLTDALLMGYQESQPIDICVNGMPLPKNPPSIIAPVKPLDPVAKTSAAATTTDKAASVLKTAQSPGTDTTEITKSPILGYVENLDNLVIYGWVIDKGISVSVKPAATKELALVINNHAYPVSATWVDRIDIAAQYGQEFINSGFEVLVPAEAIDEFLETRKKTGRFYITANGTLLKNNVKPVAKQFAQAKSEIGTGEIAVGVDSDAEEMAFPFTYKELSELNAKFGIEITAKDFNNLMMGSASYPIRISENNTVNADYYFALAKESLVNHRENVGQLLLKIGLCFERRAESLEMLGNGYFEKRDYETANHHYEAAVASEGQVSKWLFSNLGHCKRQLSRPQDVVGTLLAGIAHNPEASLFRDRFDEALQEYWLKQQGMLEAHAVSGDRAGLVAKMEAISGFIYNAYLRFYGAAENPRRVGGCNLERVLIVGDYFIPQCVRYRIDQKIEQLEAAGKKVTAISWTDLANQQNALAFHDVVIFYRVPAEVPVLKAMAQANATGKLTIYEIDDLLFDQAYPPPLETYGGYLDLNIYLQLFKGMGSFNAAARHCRYGLASTRPLADKLESLVFGGRSFLHRNGIDAMNRFRAKLAEPDKPTLDIFYGSGTMAHNSDFTDLALPGVARILDEYPQARLVIVGYLKLPAQFLKQYGGRVKQAPPAKNIKAYWAMLEHADINLAVLHDDTINGCKSELKWFEAACLGIPSVLSTTANYRDVIKDGEDALLAATPDDWYRQLKQLIDNPEQRQRMAEAAQARAQAEYGIPALAENISRVLAEALAAAQPEGRPQRRKIGLVNVFFPPQSIGGATRVVADNFELLRRDYADRFDISVFTSDADHKPPYQMAMYNHEGARVYRSTILWREHMDWHPRDEKMAALFTEYLEAEQPDLIHFHCVQRLTASVVEAAQKAGIPYIVTVHDAWWISDYQFLVDADNKVYPDGHPDPYETCPPPGNISQEASGERILFLKDLLRRAHKVLTVSNSFADIYRKNGIPEILVNKNGISGTTPWRPKDTRHKTKVVLGHIGGMAEHKGYFLLKSAIEALRPKNIELLVVDHAQEDGYHAHAHWGQVPVTFIGRVKQSHIVDLYRQIDVLVAPSVWPESYGLVTREAAACGCWVVASGLGGIGEDVAEGKSGFVIEPALPDLIECLENIDSNPEQFKGVADSPKLRCVAEQVEELVGNYCLIN